MALIRDIVTLKKYVEANLSLEYADVLPSLQRAEQKYIIPFISQALYDDLDKALNGTPNASQVKLLDKMGMALANFTLFCWSQRGIMQVSSGGMHFTTNDNKKTAMEWMVKDAQDSYLNAGYDGLEMLLSFLENSGTTYPIWNNSEARTTAVECFINNAIAFQGYYNINDSRLLFMALKPVMKTVEDKFIKGVMCQAQYDALHAQVRNKAIDVSGKNLLNFVCPAVAFLTISNGLIERTISYNNRGISLMGLSTRDSRNLESPVDADRLSMIAKAAENNGQNYLRQLKEYLDVNVANYPLYGSSKCYVSGDSGIYENDPQSGMKIAFFG